MIFKELREGWWKFGIGVLLFVFVAGSLFPYEEILQKASNPPMVGVGSGISPVPGELGMPGGPVKYALLEMWFSYGLNGAWIMGILATFLGFSMVSGEVSRGTLFLLLARPLARSRMLLTKYGVSAGILLGVSVLGALGMVVFAGLKGYPLDALSVAGLALSATLLWLGSLSVLGLATLASVIFRDVVASAVATPLTLFLLFFLPGALLSYFIQKPEPSARVSESLSLPFYWVSEDLFLGKNLAATNFLVCIVAAALPILVALWIFDRKAY